MSKSFRPAMPAVAGYLTSLAEGGQASAALQRQRSWALREAVLFAAVRALRRPGSTGPCPGDVLTPDERVRADVRIGQVGLTELFTADFVDDWLDHADPVLRGVASSVPATQRARVSSLRGLAAFCGHDLPEHRHPKPALRPLLTEPEITSALRALTRSLPGRGPDDHVRLAAVLAVMSVWPARSVDLAGLRVEQVQLRGGEALLSFDASSQEISSLDGEGPVELVLRGVAAERVHTWLEVREGLVAALLGGPVHSLWTSIRSNSRPGGSRGSVPLPPGMPLRPRGLQRAYARSVAAANTFHAGLPGFPLPRSLDLLRRSLSGLPERPR
jgi:hypothetical protein